MAHKPPKNDLERLENIIEGLIGDDENVPADATAHGIDFEKWGEEIRANAKTYAEAERRVREEETAKQRERAEARLRARPAEPIRSRPEQLAIMRELLQRTRPEEVSAHFHKFEQATDEDLARMIGELRHLIEESGGEKS
jgi:hypothetical protein